MTCTHKGTSSDSEVCAANVYLPHVNSVCSVHARSKLAWLISESICVVHAVWQLCWPIIPPEAAAEGGVEGRVAMAVAEIWREQGPYDPQVSAYPSYI